VKNLKYFLGVLFLTTQCYGKACSPFFDVYVPCFQSGVSFSFGTLFTQSQVLRRNFAETTLADHTDHNLESLHDGYGFGGYYAGIGYNFACTANDIRLNYLHNKRANNAFLLGGGLTSLIPIPRGDQLTDTITVESGGVPVRTITASGPFFNILDSVKADSSLSQNVLDLECGQTFLVTPDLRVRLFGGVRQSSLRNDLKITLGVNSAPDNIALLTSHLVLEEVSFTDSTLQFEQLINTSTEYSGLGPRFGMEVNYNLAVGFSLFGSVSAAILVGDIHSQLTDSTNFSFSGLVDDVELTPINTNFTYIATLTDGDSVVTKNTMLQTTTSPDTTRIVPNAEGKLGLSYCYPCCKSRIILEGGYLVNHYWNSVEFLNPEILAGQGESNTDVQGVSYDGVYFAIKAVL
jgi:hypothetical protein